jgi:hypothetical protein
MSKSTEDVFEGIETLKMSVADELLKLAKLKEQGVISESEFLQMKQELIRKMSESS